MKFSLAWLKKFITVKSSAEEIGAKITDAGLEVESIIEDVFDIAIPPNRADCLGMVGLSREISAITNVPFTEPMIKPVPDGSKDKISLVVQDAAACPKYLGRVIKGIDNTRQTPQWIKDCLINAEIKLISPVVDITNFVLLEWGQPLHAFDLRKLQGDVIVRKAKAGEQLMLLDDTNVQLTPQTLIIADHKKPLAIAGVKGGKDSGIASDTKDILLECAYFEPIGIRLTSRHFGLKTDGSYRFERCIDPTMQEKVMQHVTQMILDVVGGVAGPVVTFSDAAYLPKTVALTLRRSRVKKILGIELDTVTITNLLQRLGFQVESHNSHEELMVTVPAFRQDVTREVDLIEEIARIYGFDKIPAQSTVSTLNFKPLPEAKITENQIFNCLVNRGYHEAITYSFIDLEYSKLFGLPVNEELCLANPISSEMGYMRPSLIPGLVKMVQYNQNRQQNRIRLFEIGLSFNGTMTNLRQRKNIAGVCYGADLAEGWGNQKNATDLFDAKGDVMALFQLTHNVANVRFQPATDVAMHPGQCLDIFLNDVRMGRMGTLHPNLQQTLQLPEPIIMFEMDYASLVDGRIPSFNMFSKYPTVRRDLALLVKRSLPAIELENAIRASVGNLLTDLVLFDVYQGKGIAEDQKSMALGISLQHRDRTLTDAEVNDIFANLTTTLQREFNATLR